MIRPFEVFASTLVIFTGRRNYSESAVNVESVWSLLEIGVRGMSCNSSSETLTIASRGQQFIGEDLRKVFVIRHRGRARLSD